MHFGMSIGKGYSGCAVVIAGGKVDPFGRGGRKASGVVDAVRVFVQVDPTLGRSGDVELAFFGDVQVDRVEGTGLGISSTDPDVAGNTSHSLRPTSSPLRAVQVFVRGTFIEVSGLRKVSRKLGVTRIDQIGDVRIVTPQSPIQPTDDPRTIRIIRSWILRIAAVVRSGKFTFVVPRVHVRRQHQLLGVVHAEDALGFLLGLTQGWQQHSGKDGNNRDHHQQFNKRKRSVGFFHHGI